MAVWHGRTCLDFGFWVLFGSVGGATLLRSSATVDPLSITPSSDTTSLTVGSTTFVIAASAALTTSAELGTPQIDGLGWVGLGSVGSGRVGSGRVGLGWVGVMWDATGRDGMRRHSVTHRIVSISGNIEGSLALFPALRQLRKSRPSRARHGGDGIDPPTSKGLTSGDEAEGAG